MAMVWIENSGRGQDGERFSCLDLVNGDGRILATIDCPLTESYEHVCRFHLAVCHQCLFERSYRDLESAKRYCEESVLHFLPIEEKAIRKIIRPSLWGRAFQRRGH